MSDLEALRRDLAADPFNADLAARALAAEMREGFNPLIHEPRGPEYGGWWSPRRFCEATHKPTGLTVVSNDHEERSQKAMRRRALTKLRVALAFSRQPDLRGAGLARDWSEDWDEYDAYLKVGRLRLDP